MLSRFLPRAFNFFDLFETMSDLALQGAGCLKQIAAAGSVDENAISKMREIEHRGDETTHAIIEQLNKTFITPFDREDIHRLAKEMDDIIDMMNTIANRLRVYRISTVDETLVAFTEVIEQSVKAVKCAVKGMRTMKHAQSVCDSCVEVNRLENVGDEMRDRALGDLFNSGKDPVTLIKWKDIYQDAETILDVCEDVAHVIDTILVKQA